MNMRTFEVRFQSKKDRQTELSVFVDSPTDHGIILKGKIQARLEYDFKFDKRKHTASWREI